MRSVLFFLFSLALTAAIAQSTAQKRAARLGLGMNLSYLEGYWNGTRARHFSDFVKPDEVKARQQGLTDMARAGFKTVRIPVCFGAWASLDKPYRWDAPAALAAPDSLLNWVLANKLTVIIDLHHVEFDGSIPGADSTDRVVWLWQQLAERYKHTDPDRVLFELRNEPHDMTADAWRMQANRLIETVRGIAPNHTLIVGFHDWNGRDAMLRSEPFADPNIIYTFHFYDPFIFTHQGAGWSARPEERSVSSQSGHAHHRTGFGQRDVDRKGHRQLRQRSNVQRGVSANSGCQNLVGCQRRSNFPRRIWLVQPQRRSRQPLPPRRVDLRSPWSVQYPVGLVGVGRWFLDVSERHDYHDALHE